MHWLHDNDHEFQHLYKSRACVSLLIWSIQVLANRKDISNEKQRMLVIHMFGVVTIFIPEPYKENIYSTFKIAANLPRKGPTRFTPERNRADLRGKGNLDPAGLRLLVKH